MRALALLAGLTVAACSGAPAGDGAAPRQLYGEVHIHGFAGGSHPGALFLAGAVPAESARGDQLLPEVAPAIAAAGPCTLEPAVCSGCQAPPPPIDGGPVRITGGSGIAEVDLAFVPMQRTYLPSGPLHGAIFRGGESLSVYGDGAAAPRFHGTITAPVPLVLTEPASQPRLGAADFTVAWVADRSTRVDVTLVASTTDGRAALIECIGDDAAGQVTLPAALLAGLPAPPRDLQLELSRDEIVLAPSQSGGLGVILHAGFATVVGWHED